MSKMYDEFEIMNMMDYINYGWMDNNGIIYENNWDLFSESYILQTPEEVIKNKIGVCWDQVELERYYFSDSNYDIKTYFIVYYDDAKCPTHTFLIFYKNNKYYWFEHSWARFKGIHEYNSEKELLCDIKDKFIQSELNNIYEIDNLILYEYNKPNYHLSTLEFYKHCEAGKRIDL